MPSDVGFECEGAPAAAERHAAQRKDRGERRQPVKVRTGGACVSGEEATDAARSRTPMPPPEGVQ